MTKKRIGKGLGALIPTDIDDILEDKNAENPKKNDSANSSEVDIALISAAKNQARQNFADEKIAELVASIREHGVIQPLLVRRKGEGYELIAGERRLRAAKDAGLTKVPVIFSDVADEKAAEIGLIENIQRENLNALEEAAAFYEMKENYGYTQDRLAKTLGKSRSYIANALRLMTLDNETKNLISEGKISAGHARALLSVKAEPRRHQLLNKILKNDLSVRQAEIEAKALNEIKLKQDRKVKTEKNPFYSQMEDKLRDRFQTKINITGNQKGGKIELAYHNSEELERLLDMLIETE